MKREIVALIWIGIAMHMTGAGAAERGDDDRKDTEVERKDAPEQTTEDEEFWTPERLEEAQPLPMPTVPQVPTETDEGADDAPTSDQTEDDGNGDEIIIDSSQD